LFPIIARTEQADNPKRLFRSLLVPELPRSLSRNWTWLVLARRITSMYVPRCPYPPWILCIIIFPEPVDQIWRSFLVFRSWTLASTCSPAWASPSGAWQIR